MADVSYSQTANLNEPGTITLNGVSQQASGRLDAVGDVVFADFGGGLVVVCERDATDTMRITIQHKDMHEYYNSSSYYYGPGGYEFVLPAVPLNFSP